MKILPKMIRTGMVVIAVLFLVPMFSNLSMAKHKGVEVKDQGKGPPPWAPAHGYRRKFLYYPKYKIYFDFEKKQYFWLDAGKIKVGMKLPKGVRVDEEGVSVELPRETPLDKDFR